MPGSWSTLGVDLLLEIEPGSGRRRGLEHALRDAVQAGRLRPGSRLPSSRSLGAELGLARGTVTAAYDQLVAEGYLLARRGAGTVVAGGSGQQAPAESRSAAGAELPLDLTPGSPDLTTFPAAAWLRAARRALGAAPGSAYGYGDPRGRIELRAELAGYLARTRGVVATPEQIVITSGYQQALSLLARVLADEGVRTVAMEDPGLDFHRDVVRRSGGQEVLALPVDGLGARTDLLGSGSLAGAGAAVVTPAHQYPTGVSLAPQRRHALVEWAARAGAVVVEDDYDGEFRYDRQPVGALQGVAPEHVVYVGSASKTLAPGVRLGWMVLPRRLVRPVTDAKFHGDFQTESLGQLVLADLLATHAYDRHVRSCRLRYRRRRDDLATALAPERLGLGGIRLGGISAGLQTLVGLDFEGADEEEVVGRAAARGLALSGVAECWHRPGPHPAGLLVGFAAPPQRLFSPALVALADVLRESG